MQRRTFLPLVTFILLLWSCFFIHSCVAGGPVRTVPREEEITRAPALQVGIG